jgi:hypothetical protein
MGGSIGEGVARCVAGVGAAFQLHAVDGFGTTLRHADHEAACSLSLTLLPAASVGDKAAKKSTGKVTSAAH